LLTFFYRQMPELIERGHLFIAQPPLHKVARGRSEVYLKDERALDRYLVAEGLEGRILESSGGDRGGAELTALVDHALRMRNLIAYAPRKYDDAIIEVLAMAGAFDPENLASDEALERAAARLQMGDPEATWTGARSVDGGIRLDRLWRGVTDSHLIEEKFLESAEARKLHKVAGEEVDAYAAPSRLVKPGTSGAEAPAETADGEEEVAPPVEGAITRPTQLLAAVLAAGRKGLSVQRYKGLGEMNAEQLWETTLDPDNRALLQVKIEDADVTDEIFSRLMGDVVETRREFIQDNALNVANLDI